MKQEHVFSPALHALYHQHHSLAQRVIRTLFGIAGCLWVAKYVSFLLPDTQIQQFTMQQYQLYLVLLTLWGYDYRRSMRRAEAVVAAANRRTLAPDQITPEMLDEDKTLHLFSIFTPRGKDKHWFPIVFTIVLMCVACILLTKQILFLIP